MRNKVALCIAVLATAFSLTTTNVSAQNGGAPGKEDKQAKPSPFLIASGLPHLTKILMQHWDNPKLQLSEEQKTRLLVVRKETMAGVKGLAPRIATLEKQVTDGIFAGRTPDELSATVRSISELKAEATAIQLRCIYDTSAILNPGQLGTLLDL